MALITSVVENRGEAHVERVIRFRSSLDDTASTAFFQFKGAFLPGALDRFDVAAVALIFHAMRRGEDLHLEGPVSRKLLENLDEFQRAWVKWLPKIYSPVRLTAEAEVDVPSNDGTETILTYSGGVDANFSFLRHVSGAAGRQTKVIKAAALMHGFDIPLSEEARFEAARRTGEGICSRFGVPLVAIRTDLKQICGLGGHWRMEHGALLAACLANFCGRASVGLIAGDEDYSNIALPRGSNPLTNRLLGSPDFRIETDGTGYSRSEKAALIAQFPEVRDVLRVCWKNPPKDGTVLNCGQCEKCLRTKMNFLANGVSPGPALGDSVSFWQAASVRVKNVVQLGFLLDILRTAESHGIDAPWVRGLRWGIGSGRIGIHVWPKVNGIKRRLGL